ncbi:unnamed protein product [Pedinophyceae sp. YPF-701]|nr:unnamed protein product [Pedinophyceae sp. YPF-701]
MAMRLRDGRELPAICPASADPATDGAEPPRRARKAPPAMKRCRSTASPVCGALCPNANKKCPECGYLFVKPRHKGPSPAVRRLGTKAGVRRRMIDATAVHLTGTPQSIAPSCADVTRPILVARALLLVVCERDRAASFSLDNAAGWLVAQGAGSTIHVATSEPAAKRFLAEHAGDLREVFGKHCRAEVRHCGLLRQVDKHALELRRAAAPPPAKRPRLAPAFRDPPPPVTRIVGSVFQDHFGGLELLRGREDDEGPSSRARSDARVPPPRTAGGGCVVAWRPSDDQHVAYGIAGRSWTPSHGDRDAEGSRGGGGRGSGRGTVRVRRLARGTGTLLQDEAAPDELFLTEDDVDVDLEAVEVVARLPDGRIQPPRPRRAGGGAPGKECHVAHARGRPLRLRRDLVAARGAFRDPDADEFALLGGGARDAATSRPPDLQRPGSSAAVRIEPLRALDVFCGCGGLSAGLEASGGIVTAWAVERDRAAASAFAANFPDAHVLAEDVCSFLRRAFSAHDAGDGAGASPPAAGREEDALPGRGEVDLVCGGPPCQGFSGLNRDPRSPRSMWHNAMTAVFLSVCEVYKPRFVLMENVPRLAAHGDGRTIAKVVRTMIDLGYQVRLGVLPASAYGAPQHRPRLFVVGARAGEGQRLPEWPAPTHVYRTTGITLFPRRSDLACRALGPPDHDNLAPAVTVRDAIGDLPEARNGDDPALCDRGVEYGGPPTNAFQARARGGGDVLYDHVPRPLSSRRWKDLFGAPPPADAHDRGENSGAAAPGGAPGARGDGGVAAAGIAAPRAAMYRIDPDQPSHTITADARITSPSRRVLHYDQRRMLTVRESARLQGLPDTLRLAGPLGDRYRQVGNAVAGPASGAMGSSIGASSRR